MSHRTCVQSGIVETALLATQTGWDNIVKLYLCARSRLREEVGDLSELKLGLGIAEGELGL